jgi:hypothetical protein
MIRRRLIAAASALWLAVLMMAPAVAAQAQDPYKAVTDVPASEQIPALPLIAGSYGFFLLLMVFYLWTIWRRINRVEQELLDLDRRQKGAGR